ncbi:MAG: transposase [Prevotella sp.]|nr:transposase [Prevotella sp.]
MMELPERKRLRWHEFDYSTAANYFITLVVNDRQCLLGDVKNGVLVHSEAGRMVEQVLLSVSDRFPNVFIGQKVVMPNHVHLILQNREDVNVTDVMRWLKSVTTNRYIHGVSEKGWIPFRSRLWQRSYYDHVIRNQRTYDYVLNYIYKNPERWNKDLLNVDCVDNPDDIGDAIKKMM